MAQKLDYSTAPLCTILDIKVAPIASSFQDGGEGLIYDILPDSSDLTDTADYDF